MSDLVYDCEGWVKRYELGEVIKEFPRTFMILNSFIGPSGLWCCEYLRNDGVIRTKRQWSPFF